MINKKLCIFKKYFRQLNIKKKLNIMSVEKSSKTARGSVQYENTNINLLKAND